MSSDSNFDILALKSSAQSRDTVMFSEESSIYTEQKDSKQKKRKKTRITIVSDGPKKPNNGDLSRSTVVEKRKNVDVHVKKQRNPSILKKSAAERTDIDNSISSSPISEGIQQQAMQKSPPPRFSVFTAKVTHSVAASVANSILSGYVPQPPVEAASSSSVDGTVVASLNKPAQSRVTIFSPRTMAASLTKNLLSGYGPPETQSNSIASNAEDDRSNMKPLPKRVSIFTPQSMAVSLTKNILSGYASPSPSPSPEKGADQSPKRFSIFTAQYSQSMAASLTSNILSGYVAPPSSVAPSEVRATEDTAVVPSKASAKRFSMFTAQYNTQSMTASVPQNILSGHVSPPLPLPLPQDGNPNPPPSKRLSVFSAQYTQSVASSLTKNILSAYIPSPAGAAAAAHDVNESSSASVVPRGRSPSIAQFASNFILSTLGNKGMSHMGSGAAALTSSSSASSLASSVQSASPPSTSTPHSSLRRRLNSSIIQSKNVVTRYIYMLFPDISWLLFYVNC
jgi:hypothetical protein